MREQSGLVKKQVLYVDDNEHNLNSFRASFRRAFEIHTAIDSEEAYRLIEEHDIPVVVSDYKMPQENGVLFLEKVKHRFPRSMRIMLTGHADLPAVVDSINRSEIFRFLVKPWNEEDVKAAIHSAFQIYETRYHLEVKNDELKKAYLELDRLVFSTAHDITGPLTNIMGLINVTKIEPENANQYLGMIEHTAQKLKYLVRDVLSFHRNKRTELSYRKIRLKPLINSVIKEFEFYEGSSDITFNIDIKQETILYTDKSRMRYILNNLLSNAIKFQDKSKQQKQIDILAHVTPSHLKLCIRDNGVGIDSSTQERIYNVYFRGSKLSTGAGLGLYIVKEAVDLLAGDIKLTSTVGKGSEFEISIPNLLHKLDHPKD